MRTGACIRDSLKMATWRATYACQSSISEDDMCSSCSCFVATARSRIFWCCILLKTIEKVYTACCQKQVFQVFHTSSNQASTFVTFAIQITVTTIQYNTRNQLTYISQNHLFIHIFSDLWVTFRSQNLELQSTIFHQLFHVRWKFLPLNDFFSFSHFFVN